MQQYDTPISTKPATPKLHREASVTSSKAQAYRLVTQVCSSHSSSLKPDRFFVQLKNDINYLKDSAIENMRSAWAWASLITQVSSQTLTDCFAYCIWTVMFWCWQDGLLECCSAFMGACWNGCNASEKTQTWRAEHGHKCWAAYAVFLRGRFADFKYGSYKSVCVVNSPDCAALLHLFFCAEHGRWQHSSLWLWCLGSQCLWMFQTEHWCCHVEWQWFMQNKSGNRCWNWFHASLAAKEGQKEQCSWLCTYCAFGLPHARNLLAYWTRSGLWRNMQLWLQTWPGPCLIYDMHGLA